MSQRMMIFRNTILVNQFEYIGEDGPEMLATMRDDFDRYTKENGTKRPWNGVCHSEKTSNGTSLPDDSTGNSPTVAISYAR